jgi:phosphoribosylformylglycinamidine cyclo-ligase
MPDLYHGQDYDLAGFAVGAVERENILPKQNISPGDVVLGLASSGPHSNGYSLIRRIVEMSGLNYHDEAPFEASGTLAESLLRPTRIYVRAVLAAIKTTGAIKALAHITGGGFLENIPRVLPAETAADIDFASVPPQPVFGWLQRAGNLAEREMLRTFNCGIGMVVICAADSADAVRRSFERSGETVVTLGKIVARKSGEDQVRPLGPLTLA